MKTKRSSESDNETSQSHSRSRQRRKRTFFSNKQLDRLEEVFQKERFPGISTREELTEELGIKEDRIQVWFQNRRARWRKREIKNKPAPSGSKLLPIAAWPETSIPRHPQTFTGLTSFLPFNTWPYQSNIDDKSSVEVAPTAFPLPYPSTYSSAIQIPRPRAISVDSDTSSLGSSPYPSTCSSDIQFPQPSASSIDSGTSSLSSTPSHSPTEMSNSCKFNSDCKFNEFTRSSCAEVPSLYLGRRNHSLDEYNAAIGLLSVFERQD